MESLVHQQKTNINGSQLLLKKNALVFGAGGSIGSVVAKAFTAEGAAVFLSGRTRPTIEKVANEVIKAGGMAHTAVVDALDDIAVNKYLDDIVKQTGGIDIVFNATGALIQEYDNGKHAIDLTIDKFMLPVTTVLKSQFITAQAAARRMVQQHSGVIIFITGSPARGHVEGATAIGAAFGAIESFMENLAVEVGPSGVRAVCVRTTANTDSRTIRDTMDVLAGTMHVTKEQLIAQIAVLNFLKVPASVNDTANAAAFLASDKARMITGTVFNATAGAALD